MVTSYNVKGGLISLSSSSCLFDNQFELQVLRLGSGQGILFPLRRIVSPHRCCVHNSTSQHPRSSESRVKPGQHFVPVRQASEGDVTVYGKTLQKTIIHVMAHDASKVITSRPQTFFLDFSNILVTKFVLGKVSTGRSEKDNIVSSSKEKSLPVDSSANVVGAPGPEATATEDELDEIHKLSSTSPRCQWPRHPGKVRGDPKPVVSQMNSVSNSSSAPHCNWPRDRNQLSVSANASSVQKRSKEVEFARCSWPRVGVEESATSSSSPVQGMNNNVDRSISLTSTPQFGAQSVDDSASLPPSDPSHTTNSDSAPLGPRCDWPKRRPTITLPVACSPANEDVTTPRCSWPRITASNGTRSTANPLSLAPSGPDETVSQGAHCKWPKLGAASTSSMNSAASLFGLSLAARAHENGIDEPDLSKPPKWLSPLPLLEAGAQLSHVPSRDLCVTNSNFDSFLSPGVIGLLLSSLQNGSTLDGGISNYQRTQERPLITEGGARCAWPRKAARLSQEIDGEVATGGARCLWPKASAHSKVDGTIARKKVAIELRRTETIQGGAKCLWPRAQVAAFTRQQQDAGGLIEKVVLEAPADDPKVILGGARCAWPRVSIPKASEEIVNGSRSLFAATAEQITEILHSVRDIKVDSTISAPSKGDARQPDAVLEVSKVIEGGARCAWPRVPVTALAGNKTEAAESKEQIRVGAGCSWPRVAVTALNKEPIGALKSDLLQEDNERHADNGAPGIDGTEVEKVSKELIMSAWPRRLLATSVGLSLMNHLLILGGGAALASPGDLVGLPATPREAQAAKRRFLMSAAKLLLANC